jgi:Domain of unknown function (DUF5667)
VDSMRVLGVLAAWGVLAVLATLCFAVGGSIGYRRGVQDAVRQLRERRSGKTGCRPMPLPHHRHRPVTRIRLRSATSALRAAAARTTPAAQGTGPRMRMIAGVPVSPAVIGAAVAACLLAVPGVAVGATAAQPGEALWNVKRGMEQARLMLAIGPDRDAVIHVDLAARRLSELNQLLSTGGADPETVDMVIAGLRDHTESATDQLMAVAATDRGAVVERLGDLVDRQVAIIDLLLGVDCADSADQQCVALTDTREATVKLQRTAVAIAIAEGGSPVAPSCPVGATDAASALAGAAPSDTSTLAASSGLTETASDQPTSGGDLPSEDSSPTPSPTPSTGEDTSEMAGAEAGTSDPPPPNSSTDSEPSPTSTPQATSQDGGETDSLTSDLSDMAEQAGDGLP